MNPDLIPFDDDREPDYDEPRVVANEPVPSSPTLTYEDPVEPEEHLSPKKYAGEETSSGSPANPVEGAIMFTVERADILDENRHSHTLRLDSRPDESFVFVRVDGATVATFGPSHTDPMAAARDYLVAQLVAIVSMGGVVLRWRRVEVGEDA